MGRIIVGSLFLLLTLSAAGEDKPATLAKQYKALLKEFYEATHLFSFKAMTNEERNEAVAQVDKLRLKLLHLAEKNSKDPIAMDALVQVVTQEIWLENNTLYPGDGQDSPQVRAIALLLRDHVRSDKLGEACRRVHYGFRRECETFLRTVLEISPHKDVQGLACLRLAQFLNVRLHRLVLVQERPDLARRYQQLFGKGYLDQLTRQDRAKAAKEVETLFERAAEQYGEVKMPGGTTIREQVKSELNEIRHLAVGKEAQDIEGADQDGKRFKLSDYRGKVVLLYFWSEF